MSHSLFNYTVKITFLIPDSYEILAPQNLTGPQLLFGDELCNHPLYIFSIRIQYVWTYMMRANIQKLDNVVIEIAVSPSPRMT